MWSSLPRPQSALRACYVVDPMPIEVRVLPKISAIDEATWDAFEGPNEAPFLRFAFLDALEKTGCVGGDTGWIPHHLAFYENDALVGAAPAYLKLNSEGEFVFDWAWAGAAARAGIPYYPKLIVAVPFTPATAYRLLARSAADRERLLPALGAALAQLVKSVDISGAHVLFPTEAEASALESCGMMLRLGTQFHWKNAGYATFDDFLARFSSKRRNQLKRERREMRDLGIDIETKQGKDLTPALVDFTYEFYLRTVDKFTWGRRYLNREFFEEIAGRVPGFEVVLASQGGRHIAGAVNFAGPRVLYGRYWGAIEERQFLHFNVCFYHAIEEAIARKLERFEPGAGGEHKLVRGFEPSLTYSTHALTHPGLRRAVAEFLERERVVHRENAEQTDQAFR
jgi:hypothetical protein